MWRNRWLPAAIAGAVILAGTAFRLLTRQGVETPQAARAVSAGSVRLMAAFGAQFGGEMIASRAGLFERGGLRIDLQPGMDANDPINAVASGAAVFGVSRADSFLVARAKGVQIVAFAAAYVESPAVFYVLKTSGLRNPRDFVNRRIGRRAGDDTAVIFEALTAKLGLPRSTMRDVPVTSDLSVLLRGDIDVWPGHVGEEDYELTRKGVDYLVINPGTFGIHMPGTVYFASERTVREQPQFVQRFLNSVIAGWELAYDDYAVSVPMIVGFDEKSLTSDRVRFVLDRQREYLRPLASRFGEFDDSQWRSLQDLLFGQRLLDQRIDLAKAVTGEFLRDAYRRPYSADP